MAVRKLLSTSRRLKAVASSSSIPVKRLRQILWLPLRFKEDFNPAAGPNPHWKQCTDDPLRATDIADIAGGATPEDERNEANQANLANGAKETNEAYAAYLYFHPYIRRFLFDEPRMTQAAATAALRVYRLAAPELAHGLEVVLPQGQWNNPAAVHVQRFRILRCLLYQFSVGVTLLEVELDWARTWRGPAAEVSTGANLSLAEALDALDFLRRTHPAYFGVDDDKANNHGQWPDAAWRHAGGRFPLGCTVMSADDWVKPTLLGEHGVPSTAAGIPAAHHVHSSDGAAAASLAGAQSEGRSAAQKTVLADRRNDGFATPLCAPWSELLGKQAADACSQIEDDRMPYMAFLAVPEPHDISRGDWVRLAFSDYRGNSRQLPYGEAFLADFESRHCYDRYFDRKVGWTSTRYLNTGYAFTMVGKADDEAQAKQLNEAGVAVKGFFEGDGLTHFRRQYACMGLLAQFNKAALLVFSSRLSEASVTRNTSGDEDSYRQAIRGVLRDLLDFTHCFRFEGVSNQLQATELYRDWLRHLGLPELHESVMAEARAAHEYVLSEEARLQTLAESSQATDARRLTRLASYVSMAGLLLGAYGAGFPFDKPLSLLLVDKALPVCLLIGSGCDIDWQRVAVVALTIIILVVLLCGYHSRYRHEKQTQERAQ